MPHFVLEWFIHLRQQQSCMGRNRWSPERQRTLKEADWIVGWLRKNGPATTREIVVAMEGQQLEVRAHVLSKALRRSPFIVQCGQREVEGPSLSVWDFDRKEEAEDTVNQTE